MAQNRCKKKPTLDISDLIYDYSYLGKIATNKVVGLISKALSFFRFYRRW